MPDDAHTEDPERAAADSLGMAPESPCPEDMAFVDTTYCPKVALQCVDDEYNAPNHLTICNRFEGEQKCLGDERRQRFCIDRYEYPSKEGAHPPVMVDWYDADGMCREAGKRLCWESEWVSACEGPDKKPFPYGHERSAEACNIDNRWKVPGLKRVYSSDAAVSGRELARLDQSVPSGAKKGCVSDYGVYDLTGNFDEWVNSEKRKGKAKWAGLKGGAWGHVRNACRPMTTSHSPEFTYYFISFRCCADPRPDGLPPAPEGGPPMWTPPPYPEKPDPRGKIDRGWTP